MSNFKVRGGKHWLIDLKWGLVYSYPCCQLPVKLPKVFDVILHLDFTVFSFFSADDLLRNCYSLAPIFKAYVVSH